jgi:hypothetical protein
MKIIHVFCAFLILGVVQCLTANALEATGVVFNDKNHNGVRDASEHGISGVLVSNGSDIVTTEKDGRYALSVGEDTVLFVIKPSGWTSPTGPCDNITKNYYIYNPNGSPKMEYQGVAPTGPLPKSVDFPLFKQKEQGKFKAICLGDTQTRDLEEIQFFAHDILEELKGSGAAFGFTLGDNVFNNLSFFKPLVETMSDLEIPWRYVPGNHDHNHDAPTKDGTDDSFESVFGPPYYSFNYGKVHFIVFDDIRQEVNEDKYHAGLGERQFQFVKNDLAHVSKDSLVVLLMHIPIMELDEAKELYALLKDFPHTLSISGHTHDQKQVFIDKKDGWLGDTPHHHIVHGTACGSWWGGAFDEVGIPLTQMSDGGPNNYSFITFDGNKYDVEFRVPRRPADYQMNIWLPERLSVKDVAKTQAIVNVFAGSSKSVVEMSLDGLSKWAPMEQFTGQDPYYSDTIKRQDKFVQKIAELNNAKEIDKKFINGVQKEFSEALRGLPQPHDTNHIWRATLPEGLTPGAHTLNVRTTDMFGHVYNSKRIFIVKE